MASSPKTFSPVEDTQAVQFPVKVPGTDQVAQRLDKELARVLTAEDVSSQVASDVSSEVSSARTLGYVGIAVGVVGVVLAAVALLVRRGRSARRRAQRGRGLRRWSLCPRSPR